MSYRILKDGEIITSEVPGTYAGNITHLIFGRLDCKSGKRMFKENRVFFHSLEDAIREGYRPCKNCRPLTQKEFEGIKHLLPKGVTLEEFYSHGKKSYE